MGHDTENPNVSQCYMPLKLIPKLPYIGQSIFLSGVESQASTLQSAVEVTSGCWLTSLHAERLNGTSDNLLESP